MDKNVKKLIEIKRKFVKTQRQSRKSYVLNTLVIDDKKDNHTSRIPTI